MINFEDAFYWKTPTGSPAGPTLFASEEEAQKYKADQIAWIEIAKWTIPEARNYCLQAMSMWKLCNGMQLVNEHYERKR